MIRMKALLSAFVLPLLLLTPLLLTASCGYFTGPGGIFSDKEPPPLPGERISILLHQRTLVPDPKLASAEILLPPPTPNPEWPQPGGYPNHAMHHIQVNEVLQKAWDSSAGKGANKEDRLIGSPIVAGGSVFVMDAETQVTAFDAASGKRLWRSELTPEDEEDGHISGGLAYDEGRVFAATGFAQMIAMDAKTGAVIWRKRISGPMRSAPTVRGGRLFVITIDNKLVAMNAANGNVLWTHSGITEAANVLGGGSPAVDSGVVVAPYSSGELVALKVETGRVLWSDSLSTARRTDQISTLAHIRGRPVIDRGRVIAMSNAGVMVAIDLRSGRRIWDKEIGGLENPWVAGNYIFALTNESEIVALSRNDGAIHWVRPLPRFENEEKRKDPVIWTGPVLASDRLLVAGSHGEIWAVSPYTGDILGFVELSGGISVPPVIAGGSVYFLSDAADLVAYR